MRLAWIGAHLESLAGELQLRNQHLSVEAVERMLIALHDENRRSYSANLSRVIVWYFVV